VYSIRPIQWRSTTWPYCSMCLILCQHSTMEAFFRSVEQPCTVGLYDLCRVIQEYFLVRLPLDKSQPQIGNHTADDDEKY
jgi:hypothetical protein